MSDNLELVIDLDTLELVEVIKFDEENNIVETEVISEESTTVLDDNVTRLQIDEEYYITQDQIIKNKHGTFSYSFRVRDGTMEDYMVA